MTNEPKLTDEQDTECQRCNCKGCIACDARHLLTNEQVKWLDNWMGEPIPLWWIMREILLSPAEVREAVMDRAFDKGFIIKFSPPTPHYEWWLVHISEKGRPFKADIEISEGIGLTRFPAFINALMGAEEK